MTVDDALKEAGWFGDKGAYTLLDGQFGSTGKGLVSAMLAHTMPRRAAWVTTNAGPNSGHTSYFGDEKIVLMQLPTFSVHAIKMGLPCNTFVNSGAIVDTARLRQELTDYAGKGNFYVSPWAAVVKDKDRDDEKENIVGRIGSTGKGTGAALASKVMRREGAVARDNWPEIGLPDENMAQSTPSIHANFTGLVEVSQGHSLGINQGFYPHCTSRDCSLGQALSDAGVHPTCHRDSMMVFRTYPIRVAGNSGACYPDQTEISWQSIKQAPEKTTVTNKVRRVFTWSDRQYQEAIVLNQPGFIFLNFMNYLDRGIHADFVINAASKYRDVMGVTPKLILLGHGPKTEDVEVAYRG